MMKDDNPCSSRYCERYCINDNKKYASSVTRNMLNIVSNVDYTGQ